MSCIVQYIVAQELATYIKMDITREKERVEEGRGVTDLFMPLMVGRVWAAAALPDMYLVMVATEAEGSR